MAPVDPARLLAALRTMLDQGHLATPGQMPDVVALAARRARVDDGDVPRRLRAAPPRAARSEAAAPTSRPGQPLSIDGTLAGRAFKLDPAGRGARRRAGGVAAAAGRRRTGWARCGSRCRRAPTSTTRWCRRAAACSRTWPGTSLMAKLPYGDALSRVSRTRERTVATELLWDLLPPLTFGCEGLVVSAILEPCYDVAADAFDYSVGGRRRPPRGPRRDGARPGRDGAGGRRARRAPQQPARGA